MHTIRCSVVEVGVDADVERLNVSLPSTDAGSMGAETMGARGPWED